LSLVLKRCSYVLTPVPGKGVRVLEDVDVGIDGGVIDCIGSCSGEHRIDCRGRAAIPALGNAHTHAAMVLLRGFDDDHELFDWLRNVNAAEKLLTRSDVYFGTVIACVEMAMGGVGAFQDMYFYPDAVVEAAERVGLRVCTGPIAGLQSVRDVASWIKDSRRRPLLKPLINAHSLYALEDDVLEEVFEVSRELGVDVHIHVSETRDEVAMSRKRFGYPPIEAMERRGWLSDRVIAVHLNWVTSWELEYMARRGARAVVCPSSGAKLAVGSFAPVYEMMGRGIAVGLGTDGACSANRINMLDEMRNFVLLYRHNYWDTRVKAEHAFVAATYGSYRAMGLRGGVIDVGYPADVAVLRLDHPCTFPPTRRRILSHIVYSANPFTCVEYTIVGGRIVWGPERREELTKLVEEAEARVRDFVQRCDELMELHTS